MSSEIIGGCDKGRRPAAFLFCFCAVYIALFCWLGTYACPQADDYSAYVSLSELGFWGQQRATYMGWMGRVLSVFVGSLGYSLSPAFYPLLPTVVLASYATSLLFLATVLFLKDSSRTKLLFALAGTAATLAFLPALNETLYWLAGMFYFWTTALMLMALALVIRALRGSRVSFWLCLIVLFLNGTVVETACVFQGLVAFLAALHFLRVGDRRQAVMAGAFWLVSIAAFLVLALAPGTAVRMGSSAFAQAPFLTRLSRALYVGLQYGLRTGTGFFTKPIIYVLLLFLPVARREGWLTARRAVLAVLLIPILMETLAGWAQGGKLPPRAVSLNLWMMGASWTALWYFGCPEGTLTRIRASRFFRWRWALLVLCLLCSFNFIDLPGNLMEAPAYRAEHRERDRMAQEQRDAGVRDVVLPCLTVRPTLLYFEDLKLRPEEWQNRAYAEYYGLESVRVVLLPRDRWSLCEELDRSLDFEALIEEAAEDGDVFSLFMMGSFHDPDWECPVPTKAEKDRGRATEWYGRAAQGSGIWAKKAKRGLLRLSRSDRSLKGYLRELYCFVRYEASLPLSR